MADVEDYSTTAASNTDDFPEGQLPGTLNDGGRTTQADIAAWHQRTDSVITAGGTADALTGTFSPAHTSLVDGRIVVIQAASDNTTTTPTFQLDSLTAQTITRDGNEAVVAGDIQAGAFLILKYDATNTNWELLNPATAALKSLVNPAADINKTPSDFSQAIGATSSWTPSDSTRQIYSRAGSYSVQMEGYVSSAWRNAGLVIDGSLKYFDGTNMRVYNAGAGSETIYGHSFS